MSNEELQKIITILEGPIPGKMATCKQILDHSVQYHKCAGSLLDEVLRLRESVRLHKQNTAKAKPLFYEDGSRAYLSAVEEISQDLWKALDPCPS